MSVRTTFLSILTLFLCLLSINACSTTKSTIEYNIPTSPDSTVQNLDIYSLDQVDEAPKPKGGYRNLLLTMRYPVEARKIGAKGKVIVKLVVTPSGKGISHYIESSPHPSLSHESLRIVRNATFEPGMKDGQAVNTWFSMPFTYNLAGSARF